VATGNKSFKQIIRTIKYSYKAILGYFKGCFTNASAESFNAKIKAFRTQFRGVGDIKFFMYRLATLYS
jgi:transposase